LLEKLRMAASRFDSHRRALLAAGAGLPLLAGCETMSGAYNATVETVGKYIPSRVGSATTTGVPEQPTFAFPSGAQLWVMQRSAVTFHTYVASESMFAGSAQLVELTDRIIVFDTTGSPVMGRELRYYANTLKKPIGRVYISHEHYEQWSGWGEFADIQTFAPRETEAFLASTAVRPLLRQGVVLPKIAGNIAPGDERIGNVTMQLRMQRDAEAVAQAMLFFPDQKVALTGDLVYVKRHPYLGNNQLVRWAAALDQLPAWVSGADALLLPGHGAPSTGAAVTEMKRYMKAAIEAFAKFKSPAEIEQSLRAQFPDWKGEELLRQGIAAAIPRR
jgi:glyoxylase-like metal-dependent hydrolase (beta-lactamase superfamily II)